MSELTGTITDDTTTFTVTLVPDNIVIVQEHEAGRLRGVQWLEPTAAADLGRLLVAIATDREMIET
jgi:hypothetical protein